MTKYNSVNQEKSKLLEQIISTILPIFEHSELLGDAILAKIVNDKIRSIKIDPKLKTTYFTKCINALLRFLNSNIFLYHIFNQIEFRIANLIPSVKKGKVRLAKRKLSHPIYETITSSCVDFKYTSNLFEQLIAYLFVTKGYKFTYQVFDEMLKTIQFDPEDFLNHCMHNYGTPYSKIQLKPGCSCVEKKTKLSKCDNPGLFEPENFLNASCPTKCTVGKEFDVKQISGSVDTLVGLLEQLPVDEIPDVIYDLTSNEKVEDWMDILESPMVPALVVYFEKKKPSPYYRYFQPLEEIYFKYMLSKEDNELQSADALLEIFNAGLEKANLGSILGIYYWIKKNTRIQKKIKAEIKNNLNDLIAKDFFNL
jgi:hypothetical protein